MKNIERKEVQLVEHLLEPLQIEVSSHPVSYSQAKAKAKVVVFDIYGTLLSSAAGGVGSAAGNGTTEDMLQALVDGAWLTGELKDSDCHPGFIEGIIKEVRNRQIEKGIPYPEVDILAIWKEAVTRLHLDKVNNREQGLRLTALSYECRTNPVWPMVNLKTVLHALAENDLKFGIISNAQFYTPLLMEFFLHETLSEVGFEERLRVWSYQQKVGKPDKKLFSIMDTRLAAMGIEPEEVVYIGNDMRKDILPAKERSWLTILFAGDTRSLRLQEDDPAVRGVLPDMVINDLEQLLHILA